MQTFRPSCLRPAQEGRILTSSHVAMPSLSLPRKCHLLFLTAVNRTFHLQTSDGRAASQIQLSQVRGKRTHRPEMNLTTSPFLSHSNLNPVVLPKLLPRFRIRSGTVWSSSLCSTWAFRSVIIRHGPLSLFHHPC